MKDHNPLQMVWEAICEREGLLTGENRREFLTGMRNPIWRLRTDYRSFPCHVDYSDEALRTAYMMAYFPFYIEPVYRLLRSLPASVVKPLFAGPELTVTACGCGPSPELLGLLRYLRDRRPHVRQVTFRLSDAHSRDWSDYVGMCKDKLAPNFWNGSLTLQQFHCDLSTVCQICSDAQSSDCDAGLKGSDILIVQNCLNEIDDEGLAWGALLTQFHRLRSGGLMIAIDLNFTKVRDVMREVQDYAQEQGMGELLVPVTESCRWIRRDFDIPEEVATYLFTGDDGLMPRNNTRHFSLAMLRT